jgi:hypothetical protein
MSLGGMSGAHVSTEHLDVPGDCAQRSWALMAAFPEFPQSSSQPARLPAAGALVFLVTRGLEGQEMRAPGWGDPLWPTGCRVLVHIT